MDYRVALISGIDIPIPECGITLHQPTITDIGYIGESDFFVGLQTLCVYKDMFVNVEGFQLIKSNFQVFMMLMNDDDTKDKKRTVLTLLQLIFPDYKIVVTPKSLIFISSTGENMLVDENNFEALQHVVRLVFALKEGPMETTNFNPANDKAQKIAQKLMRGRERVAQQKGNDVASVLAQYTSILSIGLQISIKQLVELTVYQLYDMMERYGLYLNWDLDIKQRLAGGKPDDTPDNWMKNIHLIN